MSADRDYRYVVEGINPKTDAHPLPQNAWGIRHAAELWAQLLWEFHKIDKMECLVTGPAGSVHRVLVYVEMDPSFHGVPIVDDAQPQEPK